MRPDSNLAVQLPSLETDDERLLQQSNLRQQSQQGSQIRHAGRQGVGVYFV